MQTHQVEAEEINNLEHLQCRVKYIIFLEVECNWIKFEIDTGSAVPVMAKDQFLQKFPNTLIVNTLTKLTYFCNTSVNIVGLTNINVRYKNNTI